MATLEKPKQKKNKAKSVPSKTVGSKFKDGSVRLKEETKNVRIRESEDKNKISEGIGENSHLVAGPSSSVYTRNEEITNVKVKGRKDEEDRYGTKEEKDVSQEETLQKEENTQIKGASRLEETSGFEEIEDPLKESSCEENEDSLKETLQKEENTQIKGATRLEETTGFEEIEDSLKESSREENEDSLKETLQKEENTQIKGASRLEETSEFEDSLKESSREEKEDSREENEESLKESSREEKEISLKQYSHEEKEDSREENEESLKESSREEKVDSLEESSREEASRYEKGRKLEISSLKEETCDIKIGNLNKEKVLPSAPLTEKSSTKVVTYPELPKYEITKVQQIKEPKEPIKADAIKPFTESQLSALYSNQELIASKQFVHQFVDSELKGANAKQHPLYELLINYLRAKDKLKENSLELNQLKADYSSCQTQMWHIENAQCTAKAQCQDGVYVVATHDYKKAKFQKNLLETVVKTQLKIKRLANEIHTLHSYTTSILKLKIDHYIETVINACSNSAKLLRNAPVTLLQEPLNSQVQFHLRELRICISVLFSFQRQLYKDRDFVLDTRQWLTNMIAVLLRLSDWQDHMYILNQVLRCPAGVGLWASSYIQVPPPVNLPDSPFSNQHLNHIVSILSVLLCPVEKRDAFLEQIFTTMNESNDAVAANRWVLVDSDGEEDEDNSCGIFALKENDLVALLNQVPIDDLFRSVMLIERKDEHDIYDETTITEHHILRLFAFSTVLISLFNEGLSTYNMPRYHQFAKRLCRLIRHTLQYASDMWELFKKNNQMHDSAMLERLQTEFDSFFLRANKCLYNAQQLGAWQFLAVAPFHTIALKTLWKFFYMLHQGNFQDDLTDNTDFKTILSESSIRQQFCERLCLMTVEESYYLLNTFANMIMARPSIDIEFIQFTTINLLQIGFCGSETQESCCKCAAILLSNITAKYPALISDILTVVKNTINEFGQVMFLFSELPLHIWHPTEKDLDIITVWLLLNPITAVESYLARMILSSLNWDFSSNNQLFLPLAQHKQIALLIAQVIDKHTEAGSLLDGVKQAVGQHVNPEQSLLKWAWQLVYRLRLHATDRGTFDVRGIPEVVELDVIQKGIREQQPIASYLTLAMTSAGHLLPVVCSQGLTQMEVLLSWYKHDSVLIALHNIIPLFIDSSDTLLMCTSFQTILSNLLAADRTYMKMAKNLITTDFPGAILRQFANMIESHIHNPKWHGLIVFWTQAFVSIPNWTKDLGILYLLNLIVRTAFFIPDMYEGVSLVFKQLLEKATDKSNSTNASLLSWISGSSQGAGSSILLGPGANVSQQPWLGYLVMALEHNHVEIKTGLWPELLRQLYAVAGKTNVDSSLKKAANIVKVSSFSSGGLCLYRWAQLALEIPLEHPLLPLIWQKFFSLYLARIPPVPGAENRGSVGSKFFDGVVNTSFGKKLKKRLQESVDYYKSKLDLNEEQGDISSLPANRDFNQRCLSLFKSFVLWLEEPLLQEASLYLPSLPPQYEPRYLSAIIQNSTSPWLELIHYEVIHNEYEKARIEWETIRNRHKTNRRPPLQKLGAGDLKDPIERILRRLTSYDSPHSAPALKPPKSVIPVLNFTNKDSVAGVLQPYVKKLQQFAEIYSLQVSEHGALDCQYKDLVQTLYSNFQTKVQCKKNCKSSCAGSAVINMTFCEARQNDSVKHQLETTRTNFATLLTRSLQPPTQGMCVNCVSIEQTIAVLQGRLQEYARLGDTDSDAQVRGIAVEFFYYLFSVYNEELKSYPPTQQLFNTCMEKIGQVFLFGIERESIRLCKTILQQPNKGHLLAPYFMAVNLSTTTFLQLYSDICDKIVQMPEVTFALLSKFEVSNWLINKKPRLTERSKFIQCLFQSLTKIGIKTDCKKHSLHEIFRRHLLIVFRYEFPEHYGEVLMLILQNSGAQNLSISVWMDILDALSYPCHIQLDIQLKDQLRNHATHQKMLKQQELVDTTNVIAKYFAQERLQYGLYGLYPKYRLYIDPICLLLGMITHAVVVATLNMYPGLLANQLCDHLWPHITEMFSPWLIPYRIQQFKDSTASWIQQLTDDRAVLLPWIQADISNAQKVFNMFANCVVFIGDTLPACNNLLGYVWQFYANNFAHPTVKEHVWTVVHSSFMGISWERFWPSLSDLEMMSKVMDQYLPECHTFLSHIFLEVNWSNWLTRLMQANNTQASIRAHHCLLHLLIKLSNEPNIRQSDKSRVMFEKARDYSWYMLDVNALEQVLDWYVMSCDPRVALPNDGEVKMIDYSVLGLLRVVSCYDSINQSANALSVKKRQSFIRAYIKLLINCSSRHKQLLSNKPKQFQIALKSQLDHLEMIINKASSDPITDSNILLPELLMILNNTSLYSVSIECFEQWFSNRTADSILLQTFLRTIGISVISSDTCSILFEGALMSYFSVSVSQETNPTWEHVVELIQPGPPKQPLLEQCLVASGRLLTLHAILLKRIRSCDDEQIGILLDTVVDWLAHIKAIDTMESKLPLLWGEVIKLSLQICHRGCEEKAAVILRKFVHSHLLTVADSKGGSGGWGRGILGAIGLAKQGTVTAQCRFLCKALAGYILAQLPEPKGEPQSVRCFAGASAPVGQPGGNVECAKVLLKLDVGVSELKSTIELTLKQIQDPQNSLHNGESFLFGLVDILYSNVYLKRH